VRVTFEDKPLLSDIVFLRAWVAVDIPQLHNTMTNLLAPVVTPTNAAAVSRKGHNKQQQEEDAAAAAAAAAPAAAVARSTPAAAAAAADAGDTFSPAAAFAGARPGFVFKKGPQGLGYYKDLNPKGLNPPAATAAATSLNSGVSAEGTTAAAAGPGGWVGMRTVAELRREAGVGAPRVSDSLYKKIERAPRVFNPLKVPAKLQAALPFKTKPKVVSVLHCYIFTCNMLLLSCEDQLIQLLYECQNCACNTC
jgi:ribosome biogenesis protein BMS1